MTIKLLQVDAFTREPFKGNPAAVCLLDESREEPWMQDFAREMNLSETAFLSQAGDDFHLRWFTPTTEVDLCGHATLASAHALWQLGWVAREEPIRFQTRSGLLIANRNGEWIELDFPAQKVEKIPAPEGLLDALGGHATFVGYDGADYLVEVDSENTVRNLKPDFNELKTFPVRGIIVTSRAEESEYDFVSRFFAPGCGIDEDPVTGSAHCSLGPYWGARLGNKSLTGYQVSLRGGVVKVALKGDRVLLAGQAVTIFQGELT